MNHANRNGAASLRVAVLIKQVPSVEEMELGPAGTLRRSGVALEMNAYCRRAVSKGVELAAVGQGSCTVLTLGPPPADDVLREAIAWGADRGVLVTDPAFAGSDSLATARALVAALRKTGPYDLILVGRNSIDADTGQVGPAVAELLDLPFLGGVKRLELTAAGVSAQCEQDDRILQADCALPAVLSCAERLCEPAKVAAELRAEVSTDRIVRLGAADLGVGPWGQDGSPTVVGSTRVHQLTRAGRVLSGPVQQQVREAVALLAGDFDDASVPAGPRPADHASAAAAGPGEGPAVSVIIEPQRSRMARDLVGAAAQLADAVGGRVVAVMSHGTGDDNGSGIRTPEADARSLGLQGAHEVVVLRGPTTPEDFAAGLAEWCAESEPFAVLAAGTMWGRETSARAAARLGAGLIGDAIELSVQDGRLVAWKPAFGGHTLAAISARSAIQMVTIRPGVLAPPAAAGYPAAIIWRRNVAVRNRVRMKTLRTEDELEKLAAARCVIGVGRGVDPQEYHLLDGLRRILDAELGATRKVTDQGWLPHSRQIGITGRTIAPRLYVAIGTSGKLNHVIGVRRAHRVLAINNDPDAAIFAAADVGIVAKWQTVIPQLVAALDARTGGDVAHIGR